jgi:hypothetical protein
VPSSSGCSSAALGDPWFISLPTAQSSRTRSSAVKPGQAESNQIRLLGRIGRISRIGKVGQAESTPITLSQTQSTPEQPKSGFAVISYHELEDTTVCSRRRKEAENVGARAIRLLASAARSHLLNGRARRSARAVASDFQEKPAFFHSVRRRARSDAPYHGIYEMSFTIVGAKSGLVKPSQAKSNNVGPSQRAQNATAALAGRLCGGWVGGSKGYGSRPKL